MESALADEVMDAGTECIAVSWDFDTLVSLYGDVDLSAFDADRPLDFDAATQEMPIAALLAD